MNNHESNIRNNGKFCSYSDNGCIQDSSTASMRYTMDTGRLAAPGERTRDLGAGWSPRSVCAGPVGVRPRPGIH